MLQVLLAVDHLHLHVLLADQVLALYPPAHPVLLFRLHLLLTLHLEVRKAYPLPVLHLRHLRLPAQQVQALLLEVLFALHQVQLLIVKQLLQVLVSNRLLYWLLLKTPNRPTLDPAPDQLELIVFRQEYCLLLPRRLTSLNVAFLRKLTHYAICPIKSVVCWCSDACIPGMRVSHGPFSGLTIALLLLCNTDI